MSDQHRTLAEASNRNIVSGGIDNIGSSTRHVRRVIISVGSPYSTIEASVAQVTSGSGVASVQILPAFTTLVLPTGYGSYYVSEMELDINSETITLSTYNTGGSTISYSASIRVVKRSVR